MYTERSIPLVCTFDSDADAAYIYLDHPVPAAAVHRMIPFDPSQGVFNLDLDAAGRILGVEILGASKHLPSALLRALWTNNQDRDQTNDGG